MMNKFEEVAGTPPGKDPRVELGELKIEALRVAEEILATEFKFSSPGIEIDFDGEKGLIVTKNRGEVTRTLGWPNDPNELRGVIEGGALRRFVKTSVHELTTKPT